MPNGADIRVFTPDGSNVRIQGVGDNRAPTTFGASLPFCLMDANARPLLNRAYRATAFGKTVGKGDLAKAHNSTWLISDGVAPSFHRFGLSSGQPKANLCSSTAAPGK